MKIDPAPPPDSPIGGFGAYREIWHIADARNVLLLGLLIRVPIWAAHVVLTLHVVATLGESYSSAGALAMASTVAIAVSGPWRGRQLDRIGLRRTIGPQLVVLTATWCVAPWVGYLPLLGLVVLAGVFTVPTFSLVRQILLAAVGARCRQTALSLDSLTSELSFMLGPVLGVLAVQHVRTDVALLACELLSVLGGLLLWMRNPPLVNPAEAAASQAGARRWLSPRVMFILAASAATTVVLSGTDLGIVAALREMRHPSAIGWVMAAWGLGSAAGALLYGALHRPIPVFWLLLALALATLPVALARGSITLGALLFVAGFLCAPTITATVDHLSRVVPPQVRGEAIGWHGSALTLGSAAGAPLAGAVIDYAGWQGGFVASGLVGVVVALLGLAALLQRASTAASP